MLVVAQRSAYKELVSGRAPEVAETLVDRADILKLVNRVNPQYPNLARGMKLQGSVKVEAVVSPDGSAKTVEIKGGHPLLAQAAHDAVQKWKWVPAPKQTTELIEVKFNP
jgi:TonB family protein